MDKSTFRLSEQLASIQHQIWAHWMNYLFEVSEHNEDGTYTIPVDKVIHWKRQIETAYSDLTEKEKNSDREQVDKILAIFEEQSTKET